MLTLVTPPAVEPVTLQEGKAHLRVEVTDDDALILSLIAAARAMCELELKRAIITQTWKWTLRGFDARLESELASLSPFWPIVGRAPELFVGVGRELELPKPPLQSVSSIAYVDVNGTTQTLSSLNYAVEAGTPGRILPGYGLTWPSVRSVPASVSITFVAGYGLAAAVPDCIKAAIKLLLTYLYENRGDADSPIPKAVKAVLAPEYWGPYS